MNREQMIAWLTLEGWEPATDKTDCPLLKRDDYRIWIEPTCGDDADKGEVDEIHDSFLVSEKYLAWDEIEDKHLVKLYACAEGLNLCK